MSMNNKEIEKVIKKIFWYGHASFKIKNKKVIYIDPWQLPKEAEKADVILVTHSHFDHLSVDDIRLIKKDDTIIVVPPDGASKLMGNIKGGFFTPPQILFNPKNNLI